MTGTKSNELEKVLQRRISIPIKEKKTRNRVTKCSNK